LAGPPSPIAPRGLASATPMFQWSAVTDAAGYAIEILDTTDTAITYPLPPTSVTGTSYTLTSPLAPGRTYQWQVAAYDGSGTVNGRSAQETSWSNPLTFHVPPPVPQLDPVAGVTGLLKHPTPTFRWTTTPGAVGYRIEITGGVGVFVLPPTNVGTTSYTPSAPLAAGSTYSWRVLAYDGTGAKSDWSDLQTFHVLPATPSPAAPSGPTPSTTPALMWAASAGAAGYQVEIADITGGGDTIVLPPTNVVDTSYTPSAPLTVGHTYQWQVLAYDSSGADSTWSSPSTFSIASTPTPTPPPTPTSTPTSTPPYVRGLAGVVEVKRKIRALTIAFDQALQSVSADSPGFYEVTQGVKRRKTIVYTKPVRILSVSYDGSRGVTVRLARPVKGPLRLVVSPGIVGADGVGGTQGYTTIVD